jgi:hypothetical protein
MMTKATVCGSLIAAMGALAMGAAVAQTAPERPVTLSPVMTDVGLAPAEDRESVGAVLLETSMVPAQRKAFGVRSTPDQVQAIGEGVMRATLAAARARNGDIPDTHQLGGPPAAAPGLTRD